MSVPSRNSKTGTSPAFEPIFGAPGRAPRDGKRREIEAKGSTLLEWPSGKREQRELFETWVFVGMQAVHRAGVSFRLMAVLPRFVNWSTGDLWPSNATLARCAGGCGETTIKRDLVALQKLGLIQIELGCRRLPNGQLVRKRTIRLAYPDGFEGDLDIDDQRSTRGPDGERVHARSGQGATRGPDTLEDTLEPGAHDGEIDAA